MTIRRMTRALAVSAAAALALTACASQSTQKSNNPDAKQGGTISVAETNAFSSFNSASADGNLDVNSKVVGTTRSDFIYVDPDLKIVKDESFGTYEKLSDDPLTVKYTIKDDVVWSDGNAVDKADMLLTWAILSGHYDGGDVTYFPYAGSTEGLSLTDMPKFDGDRTMTLTYSKPYVDWEIAFAMSGAQPAHVIAKRAGLADEAALVTLFETVKPGEDNAQLKKVAQVWTEDFTTNSLPSDPELYLSNGPMVVSQMVPEQSVTLKRNDKYTGALKPNVDEITVRFIGDAAAAITALRNGEVDIIAPQPTVDSIAQIKDLPGVQVLQGSQLSYDHLDLSFDSEVFKDKAVREAFLKVIPRAQIVDRLVKPINADAAVVNSQLYLPSEGEDYQKAVDMNGSAAFKDVDVEGAKALLAGKTPKVRILYNSNNPIRVDTFSMIRESATQAGFQIEDGGSASWSGELGKGGYDAALFGWISSGVGNAGIPQIFSSNGGGNYSAYNSSAVDQLASELMVTTDAAKAEEIKREIDKNLWTDGYGVTLFQGPGMIAHRDAVAGIVYMPNQTGVWWNFWEWSVK